MYFNRSVSSALLAFAVSGVCSGAAQAQNFQPLDPVTPGDNSYALSVSANGLVAVGYESGGGTNFAVRWDAFGNAQALTPLSAEWSTAFGVSADGSVAVGFSQLGGIYRAVRWNALGQVETLTPLSSGAYSIANAVNADGSVAVGEAGDGVVVQGVRWNGSGAPQILDATFTPGGTYAQGVSYDGAIAVGYGWGSDGNAQAVRWNAAGTAELLDAVQGSTNNLAYAISGDGAFAAGWAFGGGDRAVRWNAAGEAEVLAALVPGDDAIARAINGDGSVVVGDSEQVAVRWDASGQVQSIRALLENNGVDMTGWTLSEAHGVSADGRTIVGYGNGPDSPYGEAWIARDLGLITPGAGTESLASLGQVAQGAQSYIDGLLGQGLEYALQHAPGVTFTEREPLNYAPDPGENFPHIKKHLPDAARWRAWGYAEGQGRSEPAGGHGIGQGGLSYAVAEDLAVGGALGFGGGKSDMPDGGNTDFLGLSGSAFAAYVPAEGFQAVLSAAVAGFDADIARGYMNGAGTTTSEGETEGVGYGALLRVGYAFAVTPETRLTPFGTIQAVHVDLDGYTETTGPFPAIVGDIEDTATVSRLGLEVRQALSEGSWIWGSAAWAHRFEDEGAAVDAQLVGLLGISGVALPVEQDWAELTAGISRGLGDGLSRVSASVTAYIPGDDEAAATGRLGFSRAF